MMITIYSKNNCIQCKMTKRYLAAHDVAFTEINIDEHPDAVAILKAKGFSSVPVVMRDNEEPIVGFAPDRLKSWAS